jgi:hypothetical protein
MEREAAGRRRLLLLAALLLALGAVAPWFGRRDVREPEDGLVSAREPTADDEGAPPLEGVAAQGRRAAAGGAARSEQARTGSPAPSKQPAGVRTEPAARFEDTLPKWSVRLELEGTGEPIEPRTVIQGGNEYFADVPVPLEPGAVFHVRTDDARAAIRVVSGRVPKDIAAEVRLLVPRADDPRLERLTLLVVDAVSRRPLPRAYLDLGPYGCGDVPRLPADSSGRIGVDRALLTSCPMAGGTLPGLARAIFEPDHEPGAMAEFVPSIHQDTLLAWLERGEIEVPLAPLSAELGSPARIRLRNAEGQVLGGQYVQGLYPGTSPGVMALRSDEHGVVLWERAPSFFGLLLGSAGEHVLLVVLARSDETREVTWPRLVRVELVVRGLPDGEGVEPHWELATEFRDGLDTVDPAQPTAYTLNGQPRARGRLITDRHVLIGQRARPLGTDPPRFECRLPQGLRTRVALRNGRHVDVEPQRDGERIDVDWESLQRGR